MKYDFANKVVVVTGAAGGLGKALCERLARAKAQVVALDIDQDALREMQEADIATYACNIADAAACQSAIDYTVDKFGQLDVLVNNAGITHLSNFSDTEIALLRKIMDVNFFGAVNCTKAALQHLVVSNGQIIVVSSVAGFSPLVARTGYAASKYALHGFFETLRAELRTDGVHVMMVCPAFIDTNIRKIASSQDGVRKPGGPQNTVGKLHTPHEVANRIVTAAQKNKRLLLIGKVAFAAHWLHKMFPRFFETMMIRNVKASTKS